MKKAIVKPAASWVAKDSDAQFINDTGAMLVGVGANPTIYVLPSPPIAEVQAALDVFSLGVKNAANGGTALTAIKNNQRAALAVLVREFISYIGVACKGNLAWLRLSCVPVQKPAHQPVGILPVPGNLVLSLGARSGELDASVNPVFGAVLYNWIVKDSTGAIVATEQSTASYTTFTGLIPAMTYSVTANAAGTAGPSGWTGTATQIVI